MANTPRKTTIRRFLIERVDPDQFGKFAAGLQSIITALGIIIGGAWVLYTFRALGTSEKSRAELAELDLKQRATQEELAERQPNLAIDIQWETLGVATPDKHFVSLHAKLKNDGKRPVEFGIVQVLMSPLSPQSGEPVPGVKPLRITARLLDSDGSFDIPLTRILRSGQTRTIAFMLPTLSPGNYMIQLKTTYGGMLLVDGEFKRSHDDKIDAIEQRVVNVPQ